MGLFYTISYKLFRIQGLLLFCQNYPTAMRTSNVLNMDFLAGPMVKNLCFYWVSEGYNINSLGAKIHFSCMWLVKAPINP